MQPSVESVRAQQSVERVSPNWGSSGRCACRRRLWTNCSSAGTAITMSDIARLVNDYSGASCRRNHCTPGWVVPPRVRPSASPVRTGAARRRRPAPAPLVVEGNGRQRRTGRDSSGGVTSSLRTCERATGKRLDYPPRADDRWRGSRAARRRRRLSWARMRTPPGRTLSELKSRRRTSSLRALYGHWRATPRAALSRPEAVSRAAGRCCARHFALRGRTTDR